MKIYDRAIANDIDVAGHDMRYYRAGEGQTILLVHGITTYSFIWTEVFETLSKQYDVIAVDLFGCGHSDKTLLVNHSLKSHAKILLRFLDQLKVDKAHIVGHDVGGGIAQIMMVSAPQRCLTVALVNSVAYDFWPVQPIIAMRTPIIRQMAMATLDIGLFRMLIARGMYHKERVDKAMMEAFNVPLLTKEGRKAFLHFAKCLNNDDLLEIEYKLRETTCPVLIIRGDNDIYLSSSISEKLHSEIPNSQLHRVATAGHFAMLDEPAQVTEVIQRFIKASSNGSVK
jgi:pimeloyl-ACP methyl ester carboxylesterase